ncbi:hypothetical protein [Massilia sp. MB5]|uniref:hypothetical protein n=1 Tax=Massilia sp. MB5 TaxID=2919578 RepID=UPI0035A2C7E1
MDFDVVEHIAAEIEILGDGQLAQLFHHVVAILLEQQAVPALQLGLGQVQARRVGEVRRADQLPFRS